MFTLSLKAANGEYVAAEGGGGRELVANRGIASEWESFHLAVDQPPNAEEAVSLSTLSGYYISAEDGGGGAIIANRRTAGPWETFYLVRVAAGTGPLADGEAIAIRTYNGHYVCAEGGGGRELVANRGAIGEWETFRLGLARGPSLVAAATIAEAQAVRLTFRYRDQELELIREQPVAMVPLPSDETEPQPNEQGLWVELKDPAGTTAYRRLLNSPVTLGREVRGLRNELSRAPVDKSQGTFAVVVPDHGPGSEVVIMASKRPARPSKSRGPRPRRAGRPTEVFRHELLRERKERGPN